MHFKEGNLSMLKMTKKTRCRALHVFLCLFGLYIRLYLGNERSLKAESYLCALIFIPYHILVHKMIIHIYVNDLTANFTD